MVRHKFKTVLLDMLLINIGTLITALGLVLFLIPNKIAAGGVSGLATMLYYLWQLPVGIMILVLNIPLFVIGLVIWGWQLGWRTLYATLALAVATDFLAYYLEPITADPILGALYGGAIVGVGIGLVFRAGGTTGGTDLAARLVNRFSFLSVGQGLILIDTAIILLAGLVFNAELALYAAISLLVTGKAIDMVQEGLSVARAALVITEKGDVIKAGILERLGRGVTVMPAKGGYTGTGKSLMICVVSRAEVSRLKKIVAEIDPRAFVILTGVSEVLGEGFKEDWIQA